MEKLPIEVVEQIARDLTPQDLAHICAASSCYREIFNQDIFWKPHCSLELEETLRTTPCLVEPKFVIPESEDSTLAPISQWRLAFLRENHLWKNWRTEKYKEVDLPDISILDRNKFLTNNLILKWNEYCIKIWNVSDIPSSLVAEKDFSSSLMVGDWSVVKTDMLVFISSTFAKVFYIDMINNCIDLKHHIELEETDSSFLIVCESQRYVIKDTTLIHICCSESMLRVYDLDSGVRLKEEDCPMVTDVNQRADIVGMLTSKTCDNVVVVVFVMDASFQCFYYIYIYNPQQLTFLPFVTNVAKFFRHHIAIHGHHLALIDKEQLKVYNYNTSEVLFEETVNSTVDNQFIEVLSNRIMFITLGLSPSFHYYFNTFSCADNQSSVEKVFVEGSAEFPPYYWRCKVFNDKFLILCESNNISHCAWEPSSKLLRNFKIPATSNEIVTNDVWTVAVGVPDIYSVLYYYW